MVLDTIRMAYSQLCITIPEKDAIDSVETISSDLTRSSELDRRIARLLGAQKQGRLSVRDTGYIL